MILDKIIEWADERYLYEQPHNENALIRMIIEENQEYLEAFLKNNKEEMVDALGDITVFLVGELPRLMAYPMYVFEYEDNPNISIKEILENSNNPFNDKLTVAENITFWIAKIIGADDKTKIDIIKKMTIGCYHEIMKLGYDPDKVMNEIYKEINSRTGAFDPKHGKWMKFKTPEAMAKWYKADFSICLIEDSYIDRD